MYAPSASRSRAVSLLVKQAIWSGAVVASVQPRKVCEPRFASHVAPTAIALATQAGASRVDGEPSLPDDTNVSVPRARSVPIALAKAMVNDVAVSQVPAKRALVPRPMCTTYTSGCLVTSEP